MWRYFSSGAIFSSVTELYICYVCVDFDFRYWDCCYRISFWFFKVILVNLHGKGSKIYTIRNANKCNWKLKIGTEDGEKELHFAWLCGIVLFARIS